MVVVNIAMVATPFDFEYFGVDTKKKEQIVLSEKFHQTIKCLPTLFISNRKTAKKRICLPSLVSKPGKWRAFT